MKEGPVVFDGPMSRDDLMVIALRDALLAKVQSVVESIPKKTVPISDEVVRNIAYRVANSTFELGSMRGQAKTVKEIAKNVSSERIIEVYQAHGNLPISEPQQEHYYHL